jgi:anaerobic C4-dicarboxylate transporter
MSFSQRFANIAILWGIPMVCLEFVGVPRAHWSTILIVTLPATLLGVLVYTALEHVFFSGKKNT